MLLCLDIAPATKSTRLDIAAQVDKLTDWGRVGIRGLYVHTFGKIFEVFEIFGPRLSRVLAGKIKINFLPHTLFLLFLIGSGRYKIV